MLTGTCKPSVAPSVAGRLQRRPCWLSPGLPDRKVVVGSARPLPVWRGDPGQRPLFCPGPRSYPARPGRALAGPQPAAWHSGPLVSRDWAALFHVPSWENRLSLIMVTLPPLTSSFSLSRTCQMVPAFMCKCTFL